MSDFSDEVGATSQQMNMMRMMSAGAASPSSSTNNPAASATSTPVIGAAAVQQPAGTPKLVEQRLFVGAVPFKVSVSLPPSYERAESKSERYNTLYVLDRDEKIFKGACAAAVKLHNDVAHLDGKNWYPELIVVNAEVILSAGQGAAHLPTAEEVIGLVCSQLVPWVEHHYRVEPFAAGRGLLGLTGVGRGAALATLVDAARLKLFHNVLVGPPEAAADAKGLEGGPPLEAKSAVCFCVGGADGDAKAAAAKACRAALDAREKSDSSATVMTVDRVGEQHYAQETGLGVLVALLETKGAAGGGDMVTGAVGWLGERLEKRKLERLGSLMPWHEFK